MAEEIEWIPAHMRVRLENWADSMGMGLVHIQAEDLCHPHTRLVLQKLP